MPSVYIETSIVSYLRSRQANNVIAAARQILTRRWWDRERNKYQLVTSQFVWDESSAGDPVLSEERLSHLGDIPFLSLESGILELAKALISKAALPKNAILDAQHIAIAAWHRVDYLLTWNCTHIANARMIPIIERVLELHSIEMPIICTPENMVDNETEFDE